MRFAEVGNDVDSVMCIYRKTGGIYNVLWWVFMAVACFVLVSRDMSVYSVMRYVIFSAS